MKQKALYYLSLPYHYIWQFWRFLREFGIRAHCRKLRRRPHDPAPSILCNNCIGGLLCHDLGLEFRSPTVNLWMYPDDFCRFAQDVQLFLAAEWVELPPHTEDNEKYPKALLRCAAGEITLYLQHYKTFDAAKAAWQRRATRMDFENLYLLCEWRDLTRRQLAALEALPYARKAILTRTAAPPEFPHAVELKGYQGKRYKGGDILRRPIWGVKRRYEEWDAVGFLNG
ncbi:MAG: DUF1919 domain-containing protein [Oscillospiraceae bacterium]|jgi:uncharacterized protein (DUF1919 family)|nr:DUF1919 domain-containing protein [Oscillospiraceae bacterium]